MKLKLLIPLCFFALFCSGQTKRSSYKDFLKQDNTTYCPMFLGGVNYIYTAPGKMSDTGQGMLVDGGLNIARFFTKKFIFGLFVDLKMFRGWLYSYSYTSDFHSDLVLNADFSQLNHTDSLYASEFVKKAGINNSLQGSYGTGYGFMFALANQNYPMIKAYKKGIQEVIEGYFFNKENFGKDDDYIQFNYMGYVIEIHQSFKIDKAPFYFTVFYEQDDISNASIENVKLNTFLSSDFFKKYSAINRFGFKIGFGTI